MSNLNNVVDRNSVVDLFAGDLPVRRIKSGRISPQQWMRTLSLLLSTALFLLSPLFITQTLAATLTVQLPGSGTGSVNSSPPGITCPGACSYDFTTATLYANPDDDSIFSGWGGACAGMETCTLSLSGATTVTALFTPKSSPVHLSGSYYGALQKAFDTVAAGGVVMAVAQDQPGDLTLDRGISFTLKGGYDAGFSSNTGNPTEVNGAVTLATGSMTVENIAIGRSVSSPTAPPANVIATPGSGQAGLSWDAVTGAQSYNVYYSTAIGVTRATGTRVTGSSSPSQVVSGLTNGVTYYFVVTALSADGESVESSQVTVTCVPTTAILPADRATTWQPGVTYNGGIPARSTVCATVNAGTYGNGASDATSGIQAAIDGCQTGQTVSLGAGTFKINGGNYLLIDRAITLRGAGPGQTILRKTDGAQPATEATGANPSPLIIIGPSRWPTSSDSVSANLTADAMKGTYTATVNSASGFAAGQIVLLDELSGATWLTDPGGRGQILASPDWRVVWQRHNPDQPTDDPVEVNGSTIGDGADAASWFSRRDRVTAEWKKIAGVNGNTITFTTPIHITYRASHTGQITRYPNDPHVFGVGVENLSVIGGDNGNIRFARAAESWVKNVENSVWHDEGFAIEDSFRVEIRDFYVHDAAWAQPGGAGYAISLSGGSSEVLIENGISVRANKVIVSRCSGAGSVVGYNYMDMGYINTNSSWIEIGVNGSHMVGPHHMLFEGNYSFNGDSDKTHGNSIYHTYFRNHLRGIRAPLTNQLGGTIDDSTQSNGPLRCAGLGYYSYWMSFVGNVLGAPGQMSGWAYETTFGGASPGIWMLGWDDWAPYPTDSQVAATTLRNGNYDYLTNSVHWHGIGSAGSTAVTLPSSLYLPGRPAFFDTGSGYTWPWVDPLGTIKLHTLPAKARYDAGTPFTQP
jgi:hypothetical protein